MRGVGGGFKLAAEEVGLYEWIFVRVSSGLIIGLNAWHDKAPSRLKGYVKQVRRMTRKVLIYANCIW